MSLREPVTLITGASAGIGLGLARVFARNGHRAGPRGAPRRPARCARRRDCGHAEVRGRSCWRSISSSPMPAIVSTKASPATISNRNSWSTMPASVSSDAAEAHDRAEQLSMIDLNVRTLTDFSLRWVEPMTRHRGGLLNVASVAGFVPGPGSAVYYATKAFVVSFTEALHQEWREPRRAGHRFVSGAGRDRIPGTRGRHRKPGARVRWKFAVLVWRRQGYRGLMARQTAGGAGLSQQADRGAGTASCRDKLLLGAVDRQAARAVPDSPFVHGGLTARTLVNRRISGSF